MNKRLIFMLSVALTACTPESADVGGEFKFSNEAHKAKCDLINENLNHQESNFDSSSVVSEDLLKSALVDNCPRVVKRLIGLGVNVNKFRMSDENNLPLDLAVNLNHNVIVDILRRNGAKSFAEMSTCESLSFKFHNEYFNEREVAEKSLINGCDSLFQEVYSKNESDASKYLDMAIDRNQSKIAKYILSNGYDTTSVRFGNKLIELSRSAYSQEDIKKALFFISIGFPLDEKDGAGKSAFHYALKFNNYAVVKALVEKGAHLEKEDLELLLDKESKSNEYAELIQRLAESKNYGNRIGDILNNRRVVAESKRLEKISNIKRILPNSIRKGGTLKLLEFAELGGMIDREFGARLIAISILHKNHKALTKLIDIGVPLDVISKDFGLEDSYTKVLYDKSVKAVSNGWAYPLSFVNLAIVAKNTAALKLLLLNNAPTNIASTSDIPEFEVTALQLAQLTKVAPVIELIKENTPDSKGVNNLSKLRGAIQKGSAGLLQEFLEGGGSHQQLLIQQSNQILSIPSAIIDSTIPLENKIQLIRLLHKNSYTAKHQGFEYLCRAITLGQLKVLETFLNVETEHSGMCGTSNMAMSLILQKNRAERSPNINADIVKKNKAMYDFLYSNAKNYNNLASAFLVENANNPEKVKELLELGANPNSMSHCFGQAECTPAIWYSLAQGNYKSTMLLLEAGADVSGSYRYPRNLKMDISKNVLVGTTKQGQTSLHPTRKYTAIQMAVIGDGSEVISQLIDKGGKPEGAIAMAISNSKLNALSQLVNGSERLKNRMGCSDKECDRVIHPNASNNRYETDYHETYLTFAIKQKAKTELIEILLKNGVEIDAPEGRGRKERPIELAYRYPEKNTSLINLLEKYGAKL